jgi:ribonuclease-3
MKKRRNNEIQELVKTCKLKMTSNSLLKVALTHPTYVFENRSKNLESNQRLEFLGDAVLGLVIAEYLYEKYPKLPEGELTKMRAAVVCESTLAKCSKKINLGKYLLLGKGENMTGGRERASNLADAFEAVIGAIYIEKGYMDAKKFVITQLYEDIIKASKGIYNDFKTMLQEKIQKLYSENVNYKVLSEEGPDHNKIFLIGVYLKGELLAKGEGNNKKEAEQKAAKNALESFMEDNYE